MVFAAILPFCDVLWNLRSFGGVERVNVCRTLPWEAAVKKFIISFLSALLVSTILVTSPAMARPICSSADTDPDGDGFGWENNQTCVVAEDSSDGGSADETDSRGRPYCSSADADPDGDGFGWENNQTCVVRDGSSTTPTTPATPATNASHQRAPGAPSKLTVQRIVNLPNERSSTTVVWQPPEDSDGITGYEVFRDGELLRTLIARVHQLRVTDTRPMGESFDSSIYSVRAYREDGGESVYGPASKVKLKGFIEPQNGRSPAFQRLIDRRFRNESAVWRSEVAGLFHAAYARKRATLVPIDEAELLSLVGLLEDAGFDTGINFSGDSNTQDTLRRANDALVDRLVVSSPPASLRDVIPSYGNARIDGFVYSLANQRPMNYPTMPAWQRADRFQANETVLQDRLEALPDKIKSSSQARAAAAPAMDQAKLLLGIDLVPATTGPAREMFRHIRGQITDSSPFGPLWNTAPEEDRVEYYGHDPTAWELAAPYLEIADQLYKAAEKIDDKPSFFEILVVGLVIGAITGGIGVAIFGEATLGAVVFGATTGAYTTTYLLTGSTSQAEDSAFGAMLTAGVNYYVAIPNADRTWQQGLGIAVMRGGLAELRGGDFDDAVLASLGAQYVPGLATYLESLDGVSPFVADLASTMVVSYIRHDGDWDRVADDLENAVIEGAGNYVANYVGDALPESWGNVGLSIGEIARVAVVSGGNENAIREAVNAQASFLARQGVVNAFGTGETWRAQLTRQVVEILGRAEQVPSSQQSAYIDQQLTAYVFAEAGGWLATSYRTEMIASNNGQTSRIIDSSSGLIDVVVSNLWQDSDQLRGAVNQYLSGEVQQYFNDLTPGCLPAWLDPMANVALDSILTGGNSEDLERRLITYVNTTTANSGFSDTGTCGSTGGDPGTGGDGSGDGDGDSSGPSCGEPVAKAGSLSLAAAQDAGTCATVIAFRDWLLSSSNLGAAMRSEPRPGVSGWSLWLANDNSLGFGRYRVSIADRNGAIGTILERDSSGRYNNAGIAQLTVQRDGAGQIVAVSERSTDSLFEQLMNTLDGEGLNMARSMVNGCYYALSENVAELKEAFLEYWSAESNWAYLKQQWADIQEVAAAFSADEQAFMAFFLADLVRADLYGTDKAKWAGALTCDLALVVISGGTVGAVAKLGKFLTPEGLANVRQWRDNRNRDVCNSFPTGTLVLMADGTHQTIESIEAGDRVLAANEESGVWTSRLVLDQWSHLDDGLMATVTLTDGSQVSATDDHMFWVASDGSWRELDNVEPGDYLLTPDGVTEVAAVSVNAATETLVWELDVAIDDTFAVFTGTSNVLVHNTSCPVRFRAANGAVIDERYESPHPGRGLLELTANRLADGSSVYTLGGVVQKKISERKDYEIRYPSAVTLDLPASTYDRSHLVGPGGFGHESGQILYATVNFNRSFMTTVETAMQEGYRIAEARGWELRYDIEAVAYPNSGYGGAMLKSVDYEAYFVKPDGSSQLWLDAVGRHSLAQQVNGQTVVGTILQDDLRTLRP